MKNEVSGFDHIVSVAQGAQAAKVLSASLGIELFTRISKGADSVDKVSQECGIDFRLLQILARACKSLGLLEGRGDSLRNTASSEKYLVKGRESYAGDFIELVGNQFYDAWRGFSEALITGKPVRDDHVVRLSDPRYAEAYLKAMHGLNFEHARGLASVLKLSGRNVVEVGGGLGTYSLAMAAKNPSVKFTVYDSPFACDAAERGIRLAGAKNVRTEGGDFIKTGLPRGHDVIMLTHIFSGLPPEKCESLARSAFEALPKGGQLVVNEFRMDDSAFSSLMSLNAFLLSGGGSLYSVEEIFQWLEGAGFQSRKTLKASPDFIVSVEASRV